MENNNRRNEARGEERAKANRILYLVIALILCLLISFAVWLVVHYRQDKKNDPPAGGEAAFAYSVENAGL